MRGPSLLWIDVTLAAKGVVGEAAGRFFLLFLLGGMFLALLLSGGMNRFLADRWTITGVLRPQVSADEGKSIAEKVSRLPQVRAAEYRDPEAAWKEFVGAYPGLDSLRSVGGNPLPGYVEIRLLPGRLTEWDISSVASALRPLSQVEKLLVGGEMLPHLFRVKWWLNGALWAVFGLLCLVFFALFVLQEKTRATSLSSDFAFLAERGVPGRRIALSRAAGATLLGALVSVLATASAGAALLLLGHRMPSFRQIVGPAEEILLPSGLIPVGAFLLSASLLNGAASLLGWRAARSGRK